MGMTSTTIIHYIPSAGRGGNSLSNTFIKIKVVTAYTSRLSVWDKLERRKKLVRNNVTYLELLKVVDDSAIHQRLIV